MHDIRKLAGFIVLLFLIAGCMSIETPRGAISILSHTPEYSPAMSHTVGIDLIPQYNGAIQESVQYHWIADYGTFVTWDAPQFKVVDWGDDVIIDNRTVYWTYTPEPSGSEPGRVRILLVVEDPRTGEVKARTERFLTFDQGLFVLEKYT
jgi:hypothetical protein